jgi:predicted dehydrogenase
VGLNLRRDDFYRKELTFQVSCSYGPGRHDHYYEQGSLDYPLPYVRWTEHRNFEAVLNAMSRKILNVKPLITHRLKIDHALSAYDIIQNDSRALAVILQYENTTNRSLNEQVAPTSGHNRWSSLPGRLNPAIGLIGAGNYSRAILVKALAKTPARLAWVADLCPSAARHMARKYRFEQATTDYRAILRDPHIEAIIIATDHNSHARLVCEALLARKHVFVEKPLCLTESELKEVAATYELTSEWDNGPRLLMVGFNRRFSPHTCRIRELLAHRAEPLCMNLTVNAGAIAPDHWLQDPARGGGRIIGEACHFIDLLAYLASAPVKGVSAIMAGRSLAMRSDKMSIQLSFGDGSIGTLNYFANGSNAYPKESLEIFSEGRIVQLNNFRATHGYGFKHFRKFKTWRQDKGHQTEFALFIDKIARGGTPLISFAELENVTRASFAAMASAVSGRMIQV